MAKLVRIVLILLGLGPFYASASPVPGELSPRAPPIRFGQISLQGVTYTGSGCPQGAASWSLSDDKQALTGWFAKVILDSRCRTLIITRLPKVIYDKFIAESGPGIPVTE